LRSNSGARSRASAKYIRQRPAQDRQAHIAAHPQEQPGLFYLGVALPVGKMSCLQMRALASIGRDIGDGDIRLTVWQNLLISGIPEGRLDHAKAAVEQARLDWRASSIRAGLVACTGSRGCRFSTADTKTRAEEIASSCEPRYARSAGQYPFDRLSSFLRAALHRRHRAPRGAGWRQRGRRYGGWLSHCCRRRLWCQGS
jgi:sulfite reductase beta subunit-like hemoprotein